MNKPKTGICRRSLLKGGLGVSAAAVLAMPSIVRAQGTGRIGFAMETFTVPRWKNLDKPSFEAAVFAGGFEPVVVSSEF